MAEHIQLGRRGEEIARQYLQQKGFQFLHKNWHFRNMEIDLVMIDQKELVIIEVKTRNLKFAENMDEAISFRKIKYLVNATEAYQNKFNLDLEIRFDVVSIVFTNHENYIVEHIVNAFYPPVE